MYHIESERDEDSVTVYIYTVIKLRLKVTFVEDQNHFEYVMAGLFRG